MPKASEAAKKALELDDSLSEAHFAMALVDWQYGYDWNGAEKEFRRALELAPRNSQAHAYYGVFLVEMGQLEQAIGEGRRALELEPLSLEASSLLGLSLYYARKYDQAVKELRTAVDMEPDYWFSRMYLGLAYEQQGDLASALEELQEASKLGLESEIPEPMAELGHAYAQSGRKSEAERVLQELTRRAERSYVPAYNLATVYVGLDRKEQALTLLEKAYADRSAMIVLLRVDPELDPLRSDPRYADLLRRIGLPQ
ncbi:MAG: tetratricopeptide repeat protein [Terriglobales bacterium]|jgi:Flp pilus assembly protein TadD